jgi:hypothetical protein
MYIWYKYNMCIYIISIDIIIAIFIYTYIHIDLAQEEQVDVEAQSTKAKPTAQPPKSAAVTCPFPPTPQSGITAGAIACAQGRPVRTLGHVATAR